MERAENLKKIADEYNEKKAKENSDVELPKILEKCKKMASKGNYSLYLNYDEINEVSKDRLIELGYDITIDYDDNGTNIVVSWK